MKIYLATWLFEANHGESLTKKKAKQRLLSYYFIAQQKVSAIGLHRYCRTGRLKIGKDEAL